MAALFRRRSERLTPTPDPHLSGSPTPDPMVCVRTVPDAFGARVVAARLGADGIVTELRGVLGGPYPIGCVSIWVPRDEAQIANELLLADEVESAFDHDELDGGELDGGEEWSRPAPRPIIFGWTVRRLAATLALLIILAALAGRLVGA